MEKVTGIGGIFFKAKEPKVLGQWYAANLGIDVQPWGGAQFAWRDAEDPERPGSTAWSLFAMDTKYLDPSTAPFMVNYRVADLASLLAALRREGCNVLDQTDYSEFGKFGWVIDPEGHKIELWEPPAGR